MKKPRLAVAVGYLDDDLLAEALEYKPAKRKKNILWRYVAAAVCLCVAAASMTILIHNQSKTPTGWPTYTLPDVQEVYVELIGYDYDRNKFDAVVVDARNNTVFPTGAALKFNLMVWTEVYLSNGTRLDFNAEEIQVDALGWKPGTILRVQFGSYAEYYEWTDWGMLDPDCIEVVKEP